VAAKKIFFKEKNIAIQPGCVKLIKIDSKDIYVTKYFFLFQIKAVLLNVKESWKKCQFPKKYKAAVDNKSFFLNDGENSALCHRNKLHFKTKTVILNCTNITAFLCIFNVLVSIKYCCEKPKKILPNPNF